MRLLLLISILAAVSRGENVCGSTSLSLNKFFSKFQVQHPATVVVGGYLPVIDNPWHCQDYWEQHNTNGVFVMYREAWGQTIIGISQNPFNSSAYQLYFYKNLGGETGTEQIAYLRVCKWPRQYGLGSTVNMYTNGRDCVVNTRFAMNSPGYVFGITWSDDLVTVYADRIYRYRVRTNWSLVRAYCQRGVSCAMQFVNTTSYYTLNVTAPGENGLTYAQCTSQCEGYATNVFSTEVGGYIPEDFSFNNWFLLSNDSTLIHGTRVSVQPMLVSCLWSVPVYNGQAVNFEFSGNNSHMSCNGASMNAVPDALRFNLNETDLAVAASSINLTTVDGTSIGFVCFNSSDPSDDSAPSIPFGTRSAPSYCFLNITNGVNNSMVFLAVLPPRVSELVISRFGSIYVNGYAYVHLSELKSVSVSMSGGSATTGGFWTIASTKLVEVMTQVNGTNIVKMLYCDNPVRSLKCSQLSFELDDGFYPLTSSHNYSVTQPVSFVTMPSFNDHSYVNVSIEAWFTNETYPPNMHNSSVTFTGLRDGCVRSRQFTFNLRTAVYSTYQYIFNSVDNNCPFTASSINQYLSFGSICISTQPSPRACTMRYYFYPPGYKYYLAATLYFTTTDGDFVTGTPKPLEGLVDVSFMSLNVCTQYTIYGFKGEGVIQQTNQTLLAGVYYASASGQLLAFKNVTTGVIYSVTPCVFAQQAALIADDIVGIMSSQPESEQFNDTKELPGFYYHSNSPENCTEPILVYSNIGVCASGSIGIVPLAEKPPSIQPMIVGNVSIPTNFTMGLRAEYVQLFNTPVSIDCAMYVCGGNVRCKQLLAQYTSACKTIESALQLSARLESLEVNSMLAVSDEALALATIDTFPGGGYNFTNFLAPASSGRSAIEELLFDKVVTTGLGTVDQDYKSCTNGLEIKDLVCAQYYNGIMVLPGVVSPNMLHTYSAALTGGMVMGGLTAAAALPFSYSVQARLNYVALQTDVLQRNQQMLAQSFNNAIGNITSAFDRINDAISQTSMGLSTVAQALSKVQDVVNLQGNALSHLTSQLQNNFQAISASINDIYSRLDQLSADAQVDRLITGRLAALNSFVAQSLTKYAETQASRQLATQKINECVKSQSTRYGFCGGDGDHIFSVTQAAPQGLMFFHAVLQPSGFVNVSAIAGLCVDQTAAFALKAFGLILFSTEAPLSGFSTRYYVTPRKMFEPRVPQISDFVRLESCQINATNITQDMLPDIIPEYVDVNKTLDDIISSLPNTTGPGLSLDVFNATYLNLTGEIADLEVRADALHNVTEDLRHLINNINSTLVDLEWLNRVENFVKWPWYVWLLILLALIFTCALLVFCCLATGCCGCCGCLGACCRGPRLQPIEPMEKVHVQ
nr:spike protein [Bat coronavirus]